MSVQLTYLCPKGHDSTEADFCSECGTKINGVSSILDRTDNDSASNNQQICPDCATPHNDGEGPFCEICGYNFVTGASGEMPIAPAPAASSTFSPPTQWELQISIDPSLRLPESPDPPDLPPQTIVLEKPTNLMGRTSQARAIYPDISLDFDDAISHRHAIFSLQPDGSLILRDIGSSNGTLLNGKELKPMTDVLLKSGDSIVLGHWTRIFVMS
ncbi:MAG: FHA domain-containing protein [Microcoleus sp. SU_5_6]|nr:FHA domain-containing protein [Microcoleus sp. SU_5_6]